ncbi:MAG: EAL domain-containing protein [Zoogloeaceae bacterium]|jgi:diguanylate cyclase (GGDEF)-like protein/PAS domain S-box-containing protein|nr:EAL domain-containing protein [Zoogloeaceae bacterium]
MRPVRFPRRYVFPVVLLVLLGGALAVLYVLSARVGDAARIQVELDIRHAVTLDTDINLDILRLRYRQLRHYDTISDASRRVERALDRLQAGFEKVNMGHALKQARSEWDRKHVNLEDFKRQNSVLVNSLFHFVNLADRISARLDGSVSTRFDRLARDVLIFISEQQSQDNETLLDSLERFEKDGQEWPAALNVERRLLVAHGKLIVNNQPVVRMLMRRISQGEFPSMLERAYADYIAAYNLRVEEADYYRMLMAMFAFLMILTIVLIAVRLRKTAAELARNHTLLNNIADHLYEGILSFDAEGRLNFINRRAEVLLERDEGSLIGHTVQELFPEGGASAFLTALARGAPYEGEEWLRRASANFPAIFLGGPLPAVDSKALLGGYVTSFRDVTVQREADARLRLASRVFDNLSEAMSITNANGVIESVNAAFTTITGYTELEARGHTPGSLLKSGLHNRLFYQAMWDALAREGKWQGEITNRKKNGETYLAWLSITSLLGENNEVLHYIALFSDISERKRIETRIHHLAYHDSLTKLANRLQFIERLANHIREAGRLGRSMAIMQLDLDRFKYINDSLNHAAGDILLKAVSQRLLRLLSEGDTLARVGGDEFALLLPEITAQEEAIALARQLLHEFDVPFNLHGREVFVSASVGIAMYPFDGEEVEILLKNVDTALCKAKDSGRSTFRCFQESDNENSLERLELETELRHSVARNELRLYYQPQVDARTGRMHGVEALTRWQHPVRGLLSPDRFIPLAEASGYIDTLGNWCLRSACLQFVAWRQAGIPIRRMAVNVAARQLSSPVFVDMVLNTVQETGIPPDCLELELTESAMVTDPERVFGIFAQLRKNGIRIAIDDFGTGYSSLSYLSCYPVDVVKIDKSFVQGLEHERQNRSVVQAIVLMAHAMGMETVAEGVETETQSRRLLDFGCDFLQGFLFAHPCAPEQISELSCAHDAND